MNFRKCQNSDNNKAATLVKCRSARALPRALKKKASFHTTFPSIVNISALQMQSIGLITTRTKREAYALMLKHIENQNHSVEYRNSSGSQMYMVACQSQIKVAFFSKGGAYALYESKRIIDLAPAFSSTKRNYICYCYFCVFPPNCYKKGRNFI